MTCPACGAATNLGDAFCEACGTDLPVTVATAAATPPAAPMAEPAAPMAEPAAATPPAAPMAEPAEDGGLPPATGAPVPPCPSCGAPPDAVVDGYCGQCGIKQPAPRDHLEATAEGVVAVTDRGRRHHRNEDAFAVAMDDGSGEVRALVCDGVSTSVDADLASQAAVDAALAALAATAGQPADDRHEQAFVAGRDAVLRLAWTPLPDLGPPSCTYLAATISGADVELANLGDCRAYWLPAAGPPQALTRDDSWAAEQVESGAMTEDQAYADANAHSITRWIAEDADPEWRPRRLQFTAPGEGRLLLCSDGLWNYALRPDQVAAAAGDGDGLTVARRLVDHANQAGGSDNITVVIVELPRPQPATDSPKGPAA